MPLITGSDKIYLGNTEADKLYLGSQLIWEPEEIPGEEPPAILTLDMPPALVSNMNIVSASADAMTISRTSGRGVISWPVNLPAGTVISFNHTSSGSMKLWSRLSPEADCTTVAIKLFDSKLQGATTVTIENGYVGYFGLLVAQAEPSGTISITDFSVTAPVIEVPDPVGPDPTIIPIADLYGTGSGKIGIHYSPTDIFVAGNGQTTIHNRGGLGLPYSASGWLQTVTVINGYTFFNSPREYSFPAGFSLLDKRVFFLFKSEKPAIYLWNGPTTYALQNGLFKIGTLNYGPINGFKPNGWNLLEVEFHSGMLSVTLNGVTNPWVTFAPEQLSPSISTLLVQHIGLVGDVFVLDTPDGPLPNGTSPYANEIASIRAHFPPIWQ